MKTKVSWIKQKGSKTILVLSLVCLLLVGLSIYLFTQIEVYYVYGMGNLILQQTNNQICFLTNGTSIIPLNISSAFS